MGSAVALLAYQVLQLTMSAHWIFTDLAPGTVPLFFRWRVALIAGATAAVLSGVANLPRRVPMLVTWILLAGAVATVLVVVIAP
jgi:hypothetical protein